MRDALAAEYVDPVLSERRNLLAGYRKTLLVFQQNGILPIIDVEHHWGAARTDTAYTISELLARMDRNGVALTWLGMKGMGGNEASLTECAKMPDRLVPTIIHGDVPAWHRQNPELLRKIDLDSRTGKFFAMGEFEARHYITSTNSRDVHTPVNSKGFEIVFKASEDTGIPFLLHHDAEDEVLPELEEMMQRFSKAKVVWCHVGRNKDPSKWRIFPTPDGVRRFIARYANLCFDIAQMGSMSRFPPNNQFGGIFDAVMYYQQPGTPKLRPEWKNLFNEYPERFVLGSDINTGRWGGYDEVFDRFRRSILDQVNPKASEMIAYQNAWRLMSGEEWA
jgi:predicted TIM-barrel fold metal-dependent hydrolase